MLDRSIVRTPNRTKSMPANIGYRNQPSHQGGSKQGTEG
ncbi:Bgt-20267 [Blumeria graminis f. sp. tritici]|uniref:Bgt-20267 n=2 Tax=Blumeria graminis f. sp. tritici TaxID=62690 RepID=A0A9X9QE60_BLUGR|nr:Bgt-20267 [Blumeria graminis f. sp. tritici]